MKKKLIIFFFFNFLIKSQILPSVPSNVFRISLGSIHSVSSWNLKQQGFSLNGMGRRYFDNLSHNENLRFSSDFDLYHLGSTLLDSFNTFDVNYLGLDILDTANTVEQWLTKFNQYTGHILPTLGKQSLDTNSYVSLEGLFEEKREKLFYGKNITIDYGMSDEITLSISFSILDIYEIKQNFSNYSIGNAKGVENLLEYHLITKNQLKSFIDSNSFGNLNRDFKKTLELIYSYYYKNNGPYSVNWAFHAMDNPVNNLIVDDGFKPQEIDKDSVSLADLVSFYSPQKKTGKGIDDITIGAIFLLGGEPSWKTGKKANTFYGHINLRIPYGATISSFLKNRENQFKEASIGSGVPRWSIGFLGEWEMKSRKSTRMFISSEIQFSTKATLNTPVQLFSGGHTHPDSIISFIGNTYKYDLGTGLGLNTGGEVELVKNRLLFQLELRYLTKGKDSYISKSDDWDSWMESHKGYSSSYQLLDISSQLWFLNSISVNRLGPISFDLYAGFKNNLLAKNMYSGFNLYSGITTYFQAW